jgi:hypothetical protein
MERPLSSSSCIAIGTAVGALTGSIHVTMTYNNDVWTWIGDRTMNHFSKARA